MNIETALARMGYRELSPKKWLKPIGFGVVIADLTVYEMRSHYRGHNDETYCWDKMLIPREEEKPNYLHFISTFEVYKTHDGVKFYDFSFLTIDQHIEMLGA